MSDEHGDVIEAIVAQACAPGLTPRERAGKLLAAWREWFGEGGPGILNRLQMAADVARVIESALADCEARCARLLHEVKDWKDGADVEAFCGDEARAEVARLRGALSAVLRLALATLEPAAAPDHDDGRAG